MTAALPLPTWLRSFLPTPRLGGRRTLIPLGPRHTPLQHNLTWNDESTELRFTSLRADAVCLFDVRNVSIEGGLITLSADLQSSDLAGDAWIAFTCHLPGGGSQVVELPYRRRSSDCAWTPIELKLLLRHNQRPTHITVSVLTEGPGRIALRQSQLSCTPIL